MPFLFLEREFLEIAAKLQLYNNNNNNNNLFYNRFAFTYVRQISTSIALLGRTYYRDSFEVHEVWFVHRGGKPDLITDNKTLITCERNGT